MNTDTLGEARAKLLAEAEKTLPGKEYVPFEESPRQPAARDWTSSR